MTARSTRRATLGALLSAPLASVPALAAPAALPEHEARFLALGAILVPMLDTYDQLRSHWSEPYEAWWQATRNLHWSKREAAPEWKTYCTVRAPADELETRIALLYEPFECVRLSTLDGMALRSRYAMTFETVCNDVLLDLDAYWRVRGCKAKGALCA